MDCLILFNDTDIQHYSQNVVIGKCHNHNFLCCGYGTNGCDVFSKYSLNLRGNQDLSWPKTMNFFD